MNDFHLFYPENKKSSFSYKILEQGRWPREQQHFWDRLIELSKEIRYLEFTGGEPFMNPEFLDMVSESLARGFRVLVLTNAMKPLLLRQKKLCRIKDQYGDLLVLRVSIDHYTRKGHEEIRGRDSWEPMMEGLQWLSANRFNLDVAGRTCWNETEEQSRAGYGRLFRSQRVRIDEGDSSKLVLFPEMDIMSGVDIIDNMGHKDIFIHTLQVVDNAALLTDKMEIRFSALVHDIAKPPTKRFENKKGWTFHGHDEIGRRMLKKVAKRMKLSNALRDYLMIMTKLHLRPIALAKKNITDSAVRRVMAEAGEFLDDLMILCRADITTKNPKKVKKYIANFDKVESIMQDVQLRDEMRAFQSPVRGEEIMKVLSLKPGREVGLIKKSIEDAILDGKIDNNYDAAYNYMMIIKDDILT